MKYRTTFKTHHETVLPYHWDEGSDRLEWQSPTSGMRTLLEQLIDEGHLDRYVGPNDSITRDGFQATVITHFNTLEGAQRYATAVTSYSDLYTCVIDEIPDA